MYISANNSLVFAIPASLHFLTQRQEKKKHGGLTCSISSSTRDSAATHCARYPSLSLIPFVNHNIGRSRLCTGVLHKVISSERKNKIKERDVKRRCRRGFTKRDKAKTWLQ